MASRRVGVTLPDDFPPKKQLYSTKILKSLFIINKTGLQPVSRPVEQILGFYQKVLKRDHSQRV